MSSVVHEKSFRFAVRIVRLCRVLKKRRVERELVSQLIRSGTGIAANLSEAVYGNSTGDFLYRVRVSLRECSETHMWLRLLYETESIQDKEFESINEDCVELIKLLTSISVTTQNKMDNEVTQT